MSAERAHTHDGHDQDHGHGSHASYIKGFVLSMMETADSFSPGTAVAICALLTAIEAGRQGNAPREYGVHIHRDALAGVEMQGCATRHDHADGKNLDRQVHERSFDAPGKFAECGDVLAPGPGLRPHGQTPFAASAGTGTAAAVFVRVIVRTRAAPTRPDAVLRRARGNGL